MRLSSNLVHVYRPVHEGTGRKIKGKKGNGQKGQMKKGQRKNGNGKLVVQFSGSSIFRCRFCRESFMQYGGL